MDVYPKKENLNKLRVFDKEISEEPSSASEILSLLHNIGTLGTVTHASGKYYGFIIGGATIGIKIQNSLWAYEQAFLLDNNEKIVILMNIQNLKKYEQIYIAFSFYKPNKFYITCTS